MRLGFALLGAAAVLLVSAPAHAAGEATIDHVESTGEGTGRMLLGVTALEQGVDLDIDSVQVQIGGEYVEATAEPVEAGSIERTTVLAIDTSNSMRRNDRFAEAKAAADSFLAAAPADVQVGLVTFDGEVRVVAEPTTDHDAVASAVEALALSGGTRLYDAVAESVSTTGAAGARSVLVLSDGADVSKSPIATATDALDGSGVKLDVVALQQSARNSELLTQIAEAGSGEVIPAGDPAALTALFSAQADALSRQLLVEFETPAGTADETSVSASVTAGGETFTDSAYVRLAKSAEAAAPHFSPQQVATPAPLVDERGLLIGTGALALGLAGLLALVMVGKTGDQRSMAQRQLAHYSTSATAGSRHKSVAATAPSVSLRDSAVAVAQNVVKGDFETSLSTRLSAAGVSLTAAEWLLLHAGIAVMLTVVGFILGGALGLVVCLFLGAAGPWLYLGFKRSRRVRAFNGQLAETLHLIAGGLSAGLSLPQAVDTVVREGADPIAGEMRRALIEQRLGVEIEDALDGVGDRMGSEDFKWVVMAIRIQREVGGNLNELLMTVAATLREREYLRRQVKTLSAEGRFSAWILGALPPGFAAYLGVARPEYLEPMWSHPIGLVMSGVATVMIIVGGFWLSRMVKVEV